MLPVALVFGFVGSGPQRAPSLLPMLSIREFESGRCSVHRFVDGRESHWAVTRTHTKQTKRQQKWKKKTSEREREEEEEEEEKEERKNSLNMRHKSMQLSNCKCNTKKTKLVEGGLL